MANDKWNSLAWFGIAVFICVGSLRLSLGTLHTPGPGFFPFIAGAILGSLSLVVHFQARNKTGNEDGTKPPRAEPSNVPKMLLTFFSILGYAVLMNYLGFLISTVIFLAFLFRFIEPQPWWVAISGSLLGSIAAYCIFELWLQSQLPRGPFQIF